MFISGIMGFSGSPAGSDRQLGPSRAATPAEYNSVDAFNRQNRCAIGEHCL
jgi:hypothetical protein